MSTDNIKEALESVDEVYSNAQEITGKERFDYLMPSLQKMYSEIAPNQVTLKNGVVYFNSNEDENDNAYPFQLIDLVKEASATHTACLNLRTDLVIGNGLEPVVPDVPT